MLLYFVFFIIEKVVYCLVGFLDFGDYVYCNLEYWFDIFMSWFWNFLVVSRVKSKKKYWGGFGDGISGIVFWGKLFGRFYGVRDICGRWRFYVEFLVNFNSRVEV